mgnify:CR=1 FL=1
MAVTVSDRLVAKSWQSLAVTLKSVVPGSVVPDQKANIASRIMGYIEDLSVEVGDKVDRGQLLFKIDAGDINSKIAQAQSAYQQAVAFHVNLGQYSLTFYIYFLCL